MNWHQGGHDMKFGGEFLRVKDTKDWSLNRRGTYVFNTTAVGRRAGTPRSRPTPGTIRRSWDISGLEPYLQRFDINFHPDYLVDIPRPTLAMWFGDNWRVIGQPVGQLRRALRRGLGRDQSAARDRHGRS